MDFQLFLRISYGIGKDCGLSVFSPEIIVPDFIPHLHQPVANVHEDDDTDHSSNNRIDIRFKPGEIISLIQVGERWTESKFYAAYQYQC